MPFTEQLHPAAWFQDGMVPGWHGSRMAWFQDGTIYATRPNGVILSSNNSISKMGEVSQRAEVFENFATNIKQLVSIFATNLAAKFPFSYAI